MLKILLQYQTARWYSILLFKFGNAWMLCNPKFTCDVLESRVFRELSSWILYLYRPLDKVTEIAAALERHRDSTPVSAIRGRGGLIRSLSDFFALHEYLKRIFLWLSTNILFKVIFILQISFKMFVRDLVLIFLT